MAAQKPSIPSGTRDFGPQQMAGRTYIFDTIKTVFRKYGFQPLETPTMENLSVLLGKYGDEGDKLLFKVLNSGDYLKSATPDDIAKGSNHLVSKISEKGLRYDLTVPFARYVVMNRGELTFPFRRYQIQPVWRADRPQKGRYREFYQCDADVVGTNSLICEAEIIGMLTEGLNNLGIAHIIKINNRKILTGIAEAVGAQGKESSLCVAIDKLDKIGLEKVEEELLSVGFSSESVTKLRPIINISGNNAEKMSQIRSVIATSETGMKGLEEIEQTFVLAAQMGLSLDHVELDITLARGLSYYTGAIFEVKAKDVAMGSICGGGRYDNLTGVFGMEGTSGVGISFGVDRIYDVMNELNLFPATTLSSVQVLFANFDAASQAYCLPLLTQLRAKGISAEIYPQSTKLNKQMEYANKKNIPYVVLAGSTEIDAQKVTLKNMKTGEQQSIGANALMNVLFN